MIPVDAGGWGLGWAADDSGRLHQLGLGPEGHEAEASTGVHWYPDAHPCWGDSDPFRQAALRVTHHDGTLTTRLRLDGVETAERQDGRAGVHTVVVTRDEVFDLLVEHHFLTHPDSGVLEQWVEVSNGEPAPVRLHDYDSIAPFLLVGEEARITQFGGSGWADEWRWNTRTLDPGLTTLASLGGIQPHLQRAPMLLAHPDDRTCIGFSIEWSGNTRFDLDVRPGPAPGDLRTLRLRAGANPYGADYLLEPGERFVAPAVAWTWAGSSDEVASRFHRWTRAVVLRDPQRLRPVVVNNWEATGMAFDEARLESLIQRAGELDAEVFLLDDGWFGGEFPRDDDTQGLGDWDPDPAKLPSGVAPLVEACDRSGLRFGIWVEPEMVNPRSELYRRHPDWVIRDRREPREHRQQLALDPIRDEVRDFEVEVFDRVLAMGPGTSYVKWDVNRPITEPGSTALAPERQSNVFVDNVRATWEVMDRVVQRHPEVELMLCASGGGRTDHASLRRFHEFWTSDNTDPVTRVRMQWACSHFFPPQVMAAHVTRWGQRPVEFACAVALSGRFGLDVDLDSLSDAEFATCRRAVALARRRGRVLQLGEVEHIVSPVEGPDRSRAALAHHARSGAAGSGEGSVVFAYQLEEPTGDAPRIRVQGLDGDCTYRLEATDLLSDDPVESRLLTGTVLAEEGLPWPLVDPCTARVWEVTPVAAG